VPGDAPFDGYVLCGGSSRRMGRDKALIEVDGVAMAVRVAQALEAAGARAVVAIGGDAAALTALGLDHRGDRWPGAGPLGGLVTALDHGGAPVAVVLSCDLLHPDPAAIATVVRERARLDCDVVVPVVEGRAQWLHAAWQRRVATILGDLFSAGERSMAGAALALRMTTTALVDDAAVHDADRPDDLPEPVHRHANEVRSPSIGFVDIPEIDITTLRRELEAGRTVFDVRQADEYEQAHVPGVRLLPLGQVPERVDEFPTDETVYVICRSGARSGKAVGFLRANGVDAVNVAGGTAAWIEAGNAVDTGA